MFLDSHVYRDYLCYTKGCGFTQTLWWWLVFKIIFFIYISELDSLQMFMWLARWLWMFLNLPKTFKTRIHQLHYMIHLHIWLCFFTPNLRKLFTKCICPSVCYFIIEWGLLHHAWPIVQALLLDLGHPLEFSGSLSICLLCTMVFPTFIPGCSLGF